VPNGFLSPEQRALMLAATDAPRLLAQLVQAAGLPDVAFDPSQI